MGADGSHTGPVPAGPTIGRDTGIHKVEAFPRCIGPFQAEFRSNNALITGRTVDTAITHRGKLILLKNDPFYGVREAAIRHSIQDHISYRNLPF